MVYCLVLEPQAVTPGGHPLTRTQRQRCIFFRRRRASGVQFGALCRAADCITPHLALIAQYAVKHSCTVARHICQTHSPKLYETLWIPSLQLDHASNSMASILVPKASETHQEHTLQYTVCRAARCSTRYQLPTFPIFSLAAVAEPWVDITWQDNSLGGDVVQEGTWRGPFCRRAHLDWNSTSRFVFTPLPATACPNSQPQQHFRAKITDSDHDDQHDI